MSDKVSKFFGIVEDGAGSLEELATGLDAVTEAGNRLQGTIDKRTKAIREQEKALEEQQRALDELNKKWQDFQNTLIGINTQYKLMIQFLKSDADLKQAAIDRDQKWFDANLNYYKKVTPEMQKMIDKYALNTEVSAKLEKIQVDLNIAQKRK